ncbi:uncharacterized protein LOC142776612 [Rhipicephalus microplus]|uniref:uncharacterized protein LOC142776612 n=1 Tax=Rhipicephalus microplus TaxID=6941 RepID=UPI003F6CCB61
MAVARGDILHDSAEKRVKYLLRAESHKVQGSQVETKDPQALWEDENLCQECVTGVLCCCFIKENEVDHPQRDFTLCSDFKLDGCALAISDISVAPANWFALRGLLTPCSSRIVAPRPWTASTGSPLSYLLLFSLAWLSSSPSIFLLFFLSLLPPTPIRHCAMSPEGRQKYGAFFLFILTTTTTSI